MTSNPFPGFAPGFATDPEDWQRGFETLTRQYWTAWGQALRASNGPGAMPSVVPGWQDALDGWANLASGDGGAANNAIERCNAQARHWFGHMQQIAAQFAGQDHSARQVVDAWKQALGGVGDNPFSEIFRALHGQNRLGLDQWFENVSPYLDALRRDASSWLSLPTFGIGREHQERMQTLARMQVEYQDHSAAYCALMARSGQRAFELFEAKLIEHEVPDRQLTSARALFDLWIDAAEDAYSETALSEEFRTAYGALINAQMRLRGGIQKEFELMFGLFGLPTRSEIDSAHRKVTELEREVHRLRNGVVGVGSRGSGLGSHQHTRADAVASVQTTAKTTSTTKVKNKAKAKTKVKPKTTTKAKTKAKAKTKSKDNAKVAARSTKGAAAVRARAAPARRTGVTSMLGGIDTPLPPGADADKDPDTSRDKP